MIDVTSTIEEKKNYIETGSIEFYLQMTSINTAYDMGIISLVRKVVMKAEVDDRFSEYREIVSKITARGLGD